MAWAWHICCITCTSNLRKWLNGKPKALPFAVPVVWHEQNNHADDCYFCKTTVECKSKRWKKTIQYTSTASTIRPVPHSKHLQIPSPSKTLHEEIDREPNEAGDSKDFSTSDDLDYG